MDHTDWLGNKLTDIAFEKGGISRKDRPLLLGAGAIGDPSVHQYYLDLEGPQKFFYKDGFSAEKEHFYLGDESYTYPDWLPNRSKVMLENFSLASKAYQLVQGNGFESGSLDAAIRSDLGFFPSSFLGRGQVVSLEESTFYLDVAHNPASLHGSISHFKETQGGGADCIAVLSLLADKDVSGILKLVNKYFAHVILFKSNSDRGARGDCEKHLPHDHKMSWADSIDEAVTEARQLMLGEDVGDSGRNRIFFGGSFAAVAEFFGKYPRHSNNLKRPNQSHWLFRILPLIFVSLSLHTLSDYNAFGRAPSLYLDADKSLFSTDGQQQIFVGHVVAIAPNVLISADKITLDKRINRIKATGHALLMSNDQIFTGTVITYDLFNEDLFVEQSRMITNEKKVKLNKVISDILGFTPEEVEYEKYRVERLKQINKEQQQIIQDAQALGDGELTDDLVQKLALLIEQERLTQKQQNPSLAGRSKETRSVFFEKTTVLEEGARQQSLSLVSPLLQNI